MNTQKKHFKKSISSLFIEKNPPTLHKSLENNIAYSPKSPRSSKKHSEKAGNLIDNNEENIKVLTNTLQNITQFKKCGQTFILKLITLMRKENYEEGFVIHQDDINDKMCIVIKGSFDAIFTPNIKYYIENKSDEDEKNDIENKVHLKKIGIGDIFGLKEALYNSKVHNTLFVSNETSTVWSIQLHEIQNILGDDIDKNLFFNNIDTELTLRESAVFQNVKENDFEYIIDNAIELKFKAFQLIYMFSFQNNEFCVDESYDNISQLFFIKSGFVNLFINDQFFKKMCRGAIFGNISFMDQIKNYKIISSTDTSIITFNDSFIPFLRPLHEDIVNNLIFSHFPNFLNKSSNSDETNTENIQLDSSHSGKTSSSFGEFSKKSDSFSKMSMVMSKESDVFSKTSGVKCMVVIHLQDGTAQLFKNKIQIFSSDFKEYSTIHLYVKHILFQSSNLTKFIILSNVKEKYFTLECRKLNDTEKMKLFSFKIKTLSKFLISNFHVRNYLHFESENNIYSVYPYFDNTLNDLLLSLEIFSEKTHTLKNKKKLCKNNLCCIDTFTKTKRKEYYKMTLFIGACILLAIENMHDLKIVYQNLNPDNIFIDKFGYPQLYFDFAHVKYLENNERTMTNNNTGFTAPEILLNKGHTFASDYWCFGVLLYFILNRKNPFIISNDDSIIDIMRRICDPSYKINFPSNTLPCVTDLITKLLKVDPQERLGYDEINPSQGFRQIKQHVFFKNIDWTMLKRKQYHLSSGILQELWKSKKIYLEEFPDF